MEARLRSSPVSASTGGLSKWDSMPATSTTMASKRSGVTSRPPWRSDSVTTPTGSDVQWVM